MVPSPMEEGEEAHELRDPLVIPETLSCVLNHLHTDALKNARLVCNLWSNSAGRILTSQRCWITLSDGRSEEDGGSATERIGDLQSVLSTSDPSTFFKRLDIQDLSVLSTELHNLLEVYGKHLISLKFEYKYEDSLREELRGTEFTIHKLLTDWCPELRELWVNNIWAGRPMHYSPVPRIARPLTLRHVGLKLKLESDTGDQDFVLQMLQQSPKLTSLDLGMEEEEEGSVEEVVLFYKKLSKLPIITKSLTKLTLDWDTELQDEAMLTISNNLTRIACHSIAPWMVMGLSGYWEIIPAICSIKLGDNLRTLRLHKAQLDPIKVASVRQLFGSIPSLTKLELYHCNVACEPDDDHAHLNDNSDEADNNDDDLDREQDSTGILGVTLRALRLYKAQLGTKVSSALQRSNTEDTTAHSRLLAFLLKTLPSIHTLLVTGEVAGEMDVNRMFYSSRVQDLIPHINLKKLILWEDNSTYSFCKIDKIDTLVKYFPNLTTLALQMQIREERNDDGIKLVGDVVECLSSLVKLKNLCIGCECCGPLALDDVTTSFKSLTTFSQLTRFTLLKTYGGGGPEWDARADIFYNRELREVLPTLRDLSLIRLIGLKFCSQEKGLIMEFAEEHGVRLECYGRYESKNQEDYLERTLLSDTLCPTTFLADEY